MLHVAARSLDAVRLELPRVTQPRVLLKNYKLTSLPLRC